MPQNASASATIPSFPTAAPRLLTFRPLTFSREERQAILALTYATPGAEASFQRCEDGGAWASLGEQGEAGGTWWVIAKTPGGCDVTNAEGFRVGRFATVDAMVTKMRPALAYMVGLVILRNGAQVASQALEVV